jgi:hypothetical protein
VTLSTARNCTARFEMPTQSSLSWEGYHLVGAAGTYSAAATIEFAGGETSQAMELPLVAVNAATGARSTLAAGGTWITLGTHRSASPSLIADGLESAVDPASGAITGYRVRFTVFARNDRLYKVDHISTTGQPVAQPWGRITTKEVCGRGGGAVGDPPADIASISAHWVFLGVDAATGKCRAMALRYAAGPDEAPVALPGLPQMRIHDRARRVTGYLIDPDAGGRLQWVDADFGNPVALGRISLLEPLGDRPMALLGTTEPRHLLTVSGTAVYAYDLRNIGAAPVRVYTLAGGETPATGSWNMVASESGATYLAFWRGTSNTKIIRIAADLSVATLGTVPGVSTRLRLTDGHVIVATGSILATALHSLPKAGGASTQLSEDGTSSIQAFLTSGETVWFAATSLLTGGAVSLNAVKGDGTAREQHQDTTWLGQQSLLGTMRNHAILLPRTCDRECRPVALLVVQGPRPGAPGGPGGDAGKELRVLDAATRAGIASLGALPASPIGATASLTGMPWQLGYKGLLDFSWPFLTPPGSRLFMFNTGEAGLIETTGN